MSWFPIRTKLIFCSSSEGVEPGTVWVCWCIWVVILYHPRSSLGGRSMGLLLPGRRWLVVRKNVWWPEGLSAIVFPCPRLWWAFVHVTACCLISCQECTQIQNSSFSWFVLCYHYNCIPPACFYELVGLGSGCSHSHQIIFQFLHDLPAERIFLVGS